MTADTFHPSFAPKIFDRIPAMGMPRLVSILDFVKYAAVFAAYIAIFVVSFMTVGFLEIRQANMADFNSLIAMLEQRDGYADDHLKKALPVDNPSVGIDNDPVIGDKLSDLFWIIFHDRIREFRFQLCKFVFHFVSLL